jgi:uncharacterized membrane protein YfcA
MEIIIIVGVLVLFVWICTLRGDRQWKRRTHTKPPAPEWARALFVLFVAALLSIIFVPGIMTGIQNAKVP